MTESAKASETKPRVLIFIVAYNAEKTIQDVLQRIPQELRQFDTEVLIIDDASQDQTFERGEEFRRAGQLPFEVTVLFNPANQGYGGNQKVGFHYAIQNGFDYVVLLHGDGQYAPECLPMLLQPLIAGEADAVFGSRMLTSNGALKGGMPLYKFVGNRILTAYQNVMLGATLSEFHSGYRLYSVKALSKIPFNLNTNIFHFDTEIIIQFLFAGLRIKELPIPTYYGDEICHVNGLRYAWDVVTATFLARCQRLGIFYRRNFDVAPDGFGHYAPKLGFPSPHSIAIESVKPGERVVDIGCASGYVGAALKKKGCTVIGLDQFEPPAEVGLDRFIRHDLNADHLPITLDQTDTVLLLDVIEHVLSPEKFVEQLYDAAKMNPDIRFIVSSGNIGFVIARIMLLFGQFNYGKRGILDLTHTRLFSFASFRRLFEQSGFRIERVWGVPAPFPLAMRDGLASRTLLKFNQALIAVWRRMFSYQMVMEVRPMPSLDFLLLSAYRESVARAQRSPAPKAAE
jgi:glycosyltransferase involved in cell wall biosynthesis